jgi:DNA-binding HxlR family transcriptional regulator
LEKKDQFVVLPLWFATAVSKATKSPAALLVVAYMLHASWKTRSLTFTMPNGWLEERGVSRKAKSQVLRDLEAAGLVTVERRDRKSPRVTILVL